MTAIMDAILPMERAEELAAYMEFPDWLLESVASATYSVFGPATDGFEDIIRRTSPTWYSAVMSWAQEKRHPFAERLPFTSPCHVAFAVMMYLTSIVAFTVVAKILGKHKYTLLGLCHNLALYLLSLYMSVGLLVSARAAGYSLWNNAAGTSEKEWRVAKLIWVFYVSKVPEWFDTILMLLKHNYRQVSFLHVYHHVTIYVIWFLACLLAPGGEAYYSAMVNSGVHVVMYGYYFATLLFVGGPVRAFLSKFKFIITQGQMVQFTFNCMQSVYDLVIVPRDQLNYSASLLQLLFWYMISLLVLFRNFLLKNMKRAPVVEKVAPSPMKNSINHTEAHYNGKKKDVAVQAKNGNTAQKAAATPKGAQPARTAPKFKESKK